ncbi:TPA: nuclear transport factor 2 family protein [Elizabethkingia meningoseptica]
MRTKSLIIGLAAIGGIAFTACSKKENAPSKEVVATDSQSQIEANKKLVVDFYQKMFGDKDLSAVDEYIAPEYIQHNPTVADGAKAFKEAAAKWFAGAPKTKIDVQHIAAEGDLVFIHLKDKNPDGSLTSTIDIFRIKDGKIVEHWDVHQDVPKEAANSHPMF